MADTGVTAALANVLAHVTYAELPDTVVTHAKRAVLDWLGSALAGSREPQARMAQLVVDHMGVASDATMFGAGRSSAVGAALANGMASHILELDDVHKGSTLHGGAAVIPAALAIAEREHADGHAFLLAVVVGYEAALRAGEAVNPSHYRYFHPTGTAGTFGAAAAAASIMRLSEQRMLDALGSAGTQAAGLWEFNADGAMSKPLHAGKAAMNGVLSADLARAGLTGAHKILEGDRGFFRAMSASFDASRVTAGLGQTWKITENCYKVWSCCAHTHTAVDTAVALRAKQGWNGREAAGRVTAIAIETYASGYGIVKNTRPTTPGEAQFSIAYAVASALLDGKVGLGQFTPDHFVNGRVSDGEIARLLERTTVTVADDLTAKYPGAWASRVRVTLEDGTVLEGTADHPRGNPENPV